MTPIEDEMASFNRAIRAAAYGVPLDHEQVVFGQARQACADAQASGAETEIARTRQELETFVTPAPAPAPPDFGAGARPAGPSELDLNAEIRRAWRGH